MKIQNINELFGRPTFTALYGDSIADRDRWRRLGDHFEKRFESAGAPRFFSAPGRTELGGNHTDHNNGVVLAAAVHLDSIAVAVPNSSGRVTLVSDQYEQPFIVEVDDPGPRREEEGSTTALIRGIAARFRQLGYSVGGVDASVTSDVLIGSGLSSSASIEVLIGTIFNALYNNSVIDPVTIAKIGQFAENNFFGKPAGLMDQITCAVGGAVMIDFGTPEYPALTTVDLDIGSEFALLVVNTGGSHADLTEDYASIPQEMMSVAEALGKRTAREVGLAQVTKNLAKLRSQVGDRAILRTMHFLRENDRVVRQAAALREQDIDAFLGLVRESGESSCKWLQNCYSPNASRDQGIMLALAVTEDFIARGGRGACRVHGGGFAGTIQVWLPIGSVGEYQTMMGKIFGEGAAISLRIRSSGVIEI